MPDVAFAPDTSSAAADTPASKDVAGVTSKIADAKRAEVASTDKIYGDLSSKIDRAIPRIEQLSKNAGVEAEKLKPWNEEAESAKRKTDPITAFGSLGSVVGILASAFTHAPMENAMNASAAAMNAIRAGDDKEYERAYKAHEDNLKMYLERHKIEHETYQDAVALLNTNMEAANMKLKIAAARFGDQKMLAMLDAGMDKEVIDVINAKQKMSLELQEQLPKIQMANAQMSRLFALGYDPKNATSEKSQQALVQFQQEQAKLKQQEHSIYGRGGGVLTQDRENAAAAKQYGDELRLERNDDGKPKYSEQQIADMTAQRYKELKSASTPLTANKSDEIQGKIDRVTHAEGIFDEIDALLLKHKAITGIGGMLTRPAEIVSNVFGSNETDREEFKRLVETLRLEAPRILLDTQGRPISAEAERVNTIIGGLQPGDTSSNTVRNYIELRRQFEEIKADLQKRKGGKASDGSTAPAKTGNQPWLKDPVVQ